MSKLLDTHGNEAGPQKFTVGDKKIPPQVLFDFRWNLATARWDVALGIFDQEKGFNVLRLEVTAQAQPKELLPLFKKGAQTLNKAIADAYRTPEQPPSEPSPAPAETAETGNAQSASSTASPQEEKRLPEGLDVCSDVPPSTSQSTKQSS